MNKFSIYTLKALRKLYLKSFDTPCLSPIPLEKDPNKASDMIYALLASDKPCMIARFGAVELSCIINYLSIKKKNKNIFKYIKGETNDWWWNEGIKYCMVNNAGFFPPTEDNLERFCELMLENAKEVDVLGIFDAIVPMISLVDKYLNNPQYLPLYTYDSFTAKQPWTRILRNKKVLVIHPFAELMEQQYAKRKLLFDNPNVLPEFELKTIKAVQSLGGVSNGFANWFEALDWMRQKMDATDYDIALIGCGAYGFPLAAHAKRMKKKAVHIGGGLQLLFGVKGSRWEGPIQESLCTLPYDFYKKLFSNPAWVRPDCFKPTNVNKVEGACYW